MSNMYKLSQMSQENKGGGNTSPPQDISTKSDQIRSRRWCGTWNNYTDKDFDTLARYFKDKKYDYVIGKEIGEDKKTPHLQIYFENKNVIRFSSLKKSFPKVHWEIARGTKKQNLTYCSKERDAVADGMKDLSEILEAEVLASYNSITWRPWQQEIIDLLATKPDNRTIWWIWEPMGNTGKSYICKYIYTKFKAIIADGKKDNVFNQILISVTEHKRRPNIVILDVPKHNMNFINYGAIEQIKNGLIYSGKYEGGALAFPSPHVFIFANFPPDVTKLSVDRWMIKKI